MLVQVCGSSWVGYAPSKVIKEWDCERIQMVFCIWPLPIPPPSPEKIELSSVLPLGECLLVL